MTEKLEVEIVEHIHGYYKVVINGITIAQYKQWDKANELVEHFLEINKDKIPKRL